MFLLLITKYIGRSPLASVIKLFCVVLLEKQTKEKNSENKKAKPHQSYLEMEGIPQVPTSTLTDYHPENCGSCAK